MVVSRDRDDIDEILISEFNEYKDKIHIVDMGFNPVSSTIVRNYIKQDRYDELDSIMDIRVLKYITDRNMYKGS
jgi:nicotinic acid mononucleotide adenylyltransferase